MDRFASMETFISLRALGPELRHDSLNEGPDYGL